MLSEGGGGEPERPFHHRQAAAVSDNMYLWQLYAMLSEIHHCSLVALSVSRLLLEICENSLIVLICLSARDLMELDVERRKTAGKDAGSLDYTPVVGSCVCLVMLYV